MLPKSIPAGQGIANLDSVPMTANLTAGIHNRHRNRSMRWFKHYAEASDNSFIEDLEEKFGLEGYARWYKLLEVISRSMDGSDKCCASHSIKKWQFFLKAKQKKLVPFLEYLQNQGRISFKATGNILEIHSPILLNCRDEYSRKSGHNSENVAAKNNQNNQILSEEKCVLSEDHQWHPGCTALPAPYWIGVGKPKKQGARP